jgi:hypothetical protein
MATLDNDQVVELLIAIAVNGIQEEIWYREGTDEAAGHLRLFVVADGIWSWGVSDLEEIDSVDDFHTAINDCFDATEGDTTFAPILYACRRRGQAPPRGRYPTDRRLWPLFDACDPTLDPTAVTG